MKKFLLFLLVVIATVGFATSLNWMKKSHEIEGETFTVLYSKSFTHSGWFGIKSERGLIVASTASSPNIYTFEVPRKELLPANKVFTFTTLGRMVLFEKVTPPPQASN